MARSFGKVFSSRHGDSDWRQLSRDAQWLYDTLISQSRLTLAGSLDLMPGRWAQLAAGTSVADVEAALVELSSARFVAVDRDTEEVVIRTLVRHDLDPGRLNRNLIKGLWTAWVGIISPTLRKVVVDNLPDVVWDKSDASVPDEAQQMRSSPRLELPASTNGLDHRSEPPAETTGCDGPSEPPSPSRVTVASHLSPVDGQLSPAAARSPRAELSPDPPTPAAAENHSPAPAQGIGDPTERQALIDAAARILAERRAAVRPDVGPGWVRATALGIAKDHHQRAHAHLANLPAGSLDPTPEQLADFLDPPRRTKPPDPVTEAQAAQQASVERSQRIHQGERCPTCGGTGWADQDDGTAAVCAACDGSGTGEPPQGDEPPDQSKVQAIQDGIRQRLRPHTPQDDT